MRRSAWVLGVAAGLMVGSANAQPANNGSAARAQELARTIDRHIAARWTSAKVEPAPLPDDAEFLRRVTLDLIGRISSVAETRSFLADTAPSRFGTEEQLREIDTDGDGLISPLEADRYDVRHRKE